MSSKSFNNKSSKSSQNGKKSKRYEGQITVDSRLMGPLIGRGGCNIRRICSTCRFGTFIKGLSDGTTFTISSYSADAVKTAARMIKMDEEALIDPTKRSSKPFQTFNMDDEYVSHVVGKDGGCIMTIMEKVGDGCYIVHRDGEFHITANSINDVQHAIKLIEQERDAYIKWSMGIDDEPAPLMTNTSSRTSGKPKMVRASTNAFAGLQSDSEDEEEPEEMAFRSHLAKELKVEGHRLSNASVQRFIQASLNAGVSAGEINQSAFPSLKTTGDRPNITMRVSDKTPWSNTESLMTSMTTPKKTVSRPPPQKLFMPGKRDTRSWADMADSDEDSDED